MEAKINDLIEFLRFPSISTDRAYTDNVSECAEWLYNKFLTMGLSAEVHGTVGHPIVIAKNQRRPDRRTVMIYGHYDVQPVDPLELWTHPPFEPHIENGKIFARGSTDNKGQIMAHIQGIDEMLRRDGDLPVNLIILVEGEEEVGSQSLDQFLRENKESLRCDVVAISDTGMMAPGVPTLAYGLRGIASMELKINGPAMDLHSGIYGGAVCNPVTVLARMLATLHEPDGRVAVKGFYDDVVPLQTWEREAWAKLPFEDEEILQITGVPALFGEAGYTTLERLWGRPTVELNGIGGGYQGEGSKTVISKDAFAKLTFRLVPDQNPRRIVAQVEEHLRRVCPAGARMEVEIGHSGEAFLMDPHSPNGLAAQRALRRTFPGEVALIREGGSIPIVQTFKEVLGVDVLLLGLALPDSNTHSPNENFPIENYLAGIRLNQALLEELAAV